MSLRPPDWDQLHALHAVLAHGSLSAAARELGLSQPTVRRQIESLEARTGAALFTRTPAGLTPTETARALAGLVETMAHAADAVVRTASADAGAIAGTVRISASEVIAAEVLPGVLAALLAAHPALALEISASNRTEDVLRREVDIAVRMTRPVQEALRARKVGEVRVCLCARRDYLARAGTPQTLDDLRVHRLVGLDQPTPLLRDLQQQGYPIARDWFGLRSDSDAVQHAAIRAGIGIGGMQAPLIARSPDLVPVLEGQFGLALETWVVAHEDLRGVARIAAVFDALVEGLAAYMGGSA